MYGEGEEADDDDEEEDEAKLGEAILSKGRVKLYRSTVASSLNRADGEGVARAERGPLLLVSLVLRLLRAKDVRFMDRISEGVGLGRWARREGKSSMSRSSSSGNSRLRPPRVPVRERADGEVRRDLWRCGERGVRGVKGVSGTSWLVL